MNGKSLSGRWLRRAAMLTALGLALAACGSDGGDSGNNGGTTGGSAGGLISGNTVSPTAGASSDNFVAVVKQLVAMGMDETSEPLVVQGVDAPAEDASEPVAAL